MLPDGHLQKQESYFKMEHALYANERYLNLTKVQRCLLIDFCGQYNGRNNGDLVLTPTFADEFQWVYKTVKENKQALIDSGLVRLVGRKPLNSGKFMNLYAIAWRNLDEDCNTWIEEEAKKKKPLSLKFS